MLSCNFCPAHRAVRTGCATASNPTAPGPVSSPGKTLTEHKADRATVVREALLSAGMVAPEIERMAATVMASDGLGTSPPSQPTCHNTGLGSRSPVRLLWVLRGSSPGYPRTPVADRQRSIGRCDEVSQAWSTAAKYSNGAAARHSSTGLVGVQRGSAKPMPSLCKQGVKLPVRQRLSKASIAPVASGEPVSVLVSFATVQRRSRLVVMPVIAASRWSEPRRTAEG
jgi:hypothetical protein